MLSAQRTLRGLYALWRIELSVVATRMILRPRARDAAMLVKYQLGTMENSPEDLRRCRMRNCCAIKDSKSAHSRFPPRAIFRGYSDTFRNLIARISDFYSERLANFRNSARFKYYISRVDIAPRLFRRILSRLLLEAVAPTPASKARK